MRLIPILGPTATGKTHIAIEVALHQNAEIISCDARQFYKELHIGTALPSTHQLQKVRHHFIQSHSIFDPISAVDFEKQALNIIKNTSKNILLVGGSGLYAQALLYGLDEIPKIPNSIRTSLENLHAQEGIKGLQTLFQRSDPISYSKIDSQNPRRLIRALEVKLYTGKSLSYFHTKKNMRFATRIFILTQTKETLQQNIANRIDNMIRQGLIEEMRRLLPYRKKAPLLENTIGYQELIPYLEGKASKETCIEQIKSNTLKYAKRQMTWFKKMKNTVYISPPNQSEKILSQL